MATDKTIVLVGLMGSGKSSIGKLLASRMGRFFVDTDKVIEERSKMTISAYFEAHGEDAFRRFESELVQEFMGYSPHVLATGGGTYIQPKNRELIKQKALTVWLDARYDILYERVARKKTRPILEKGNKAEILRTLMDERNPIYAQADIHVKSDVGPHTNVVEAILTQLKEHDAHA